MAQSNQSPGSIKGVTPLAYTGTVPNMVFNTRRPTARDVLGIELGTWWIILKKKSGAAASDPTREVWILVGNSQQAASWKKMNGGSGPTEEQSIKVTVIDAIGAGLFTFDPGMYQVQVECVGGGGGGIGLAELTGFDVSFTGCGGGAYCKKMFTSLAVGNSQSYVVGAGGSGAIAPMTAFLIGSNGVATTFGSFLVAGGGLATLEGQPGGNPYAGGVATGGDINISGETGSPSVVTGVGGKGGSSGSSLGWGGNPCNGVVLLAPGVYAIIDGVAGLPYGGGASNAAIDSLGGIGNSPRLNGKNGGSGVIIITEYLS